MPELTLKLRSLGLVAALLLAPAIHAQTPPPPAATIYPPYDVVSIKPNKSDNGSMSFKTSLSSFECSNIELKSLLAIAYGVKEDLVSSLPSAFTSSHFDVEAKVLDPNLDALKKLPLDQKNARYKSMMLQLLIDRFHLQAHIETKELPVYELLLAKGGPSFKEAAPEVPATDGAAPAKPANGVGRGGMSTHNNGNSIELKASAVPMSDLADVLFYQFHRTVLDKTGLTGKYDLSLKWTRDDAPPPPDNPSETPPPAIFTALQEQLGLKLQSSKGPIDTLVIDHIEMPTEN